MAIKPSIISDITFLLPENSLEVQMPCLDCGRNQDYSSQIEQVFLAYDLFKKGMDSLKFGNMTDALPALQSCYQLRTKVGMIKS